MQTLALTSLQWMPFFCCLLGTFHASLDEGVRGPIYDDQINWSLWSAPFTESGQPIQLPSPRQYFQFEIQIKRNAILDGLRLNSFSVEHTIPPVAQLLVAEISQLDDPRPVGDVPTTCTGQQERSNLTGIDENAVRLVLIVCLVGIAIGPIMLFGVQIGAPA